ncbi:type VI secretion system membrane subunit TssM [Cupriavidus consociatus]|uniref:type VI secretion system membrane subunit TssM n=1 Tax=Cupriavidus consociatus TaxID=2821357 RepID=UPI001AEAF2C6|nr:MULTISPECIES: type VI secretion system membrane subunit TssM [unclassified Cupriavidus]MBP0623609.1 type VI secretion system membrane subunit TssM [Cupriavidus sp. LEh25]MDK2660312.1 type VI secretion system membrane subunit TssM [Cupriavidus sp. LEh21]
MELLKRCLAVLFSRQALVYVALALATAATWFTGPLLAFNGLRPLAETGMRVAAILLLLALALLLVLRWSVAVIGVAVLCLAIWHAGPLLAVGTAHPLASDVVRVVAIAVLVFLLAAYEVFRFLRRSQGNDSLLQKLLNFGGKPPEVVARNELAIVHETVQKALRQLKGMRSGGGIGRVLEGRRYLYELPWYMIVGVTGAGKTTALLNAGLQFPLPEQMSAGAMAGKDRGTLAASWWLSNEAVLIDTAGRYTSHGQNPKVDQAEWTGFLAMLRRYRSRAPINGAVLAISTRDLLTQSPEARMRQAASLRARLADLRTDLGIRFPVYVIVTKLDQLAGFGAYFQYLSSEGRAQPWGFAFPHDDRKARRSDVPDAFVQRCRTELALLVERLQAGLDARLYEEYDPQRRKDLFALPQEFAGLAEPIVDMLAQVFLESRFDDTESAHMLRGVYFTSAAQTSATVMADHETVLRRLERNQADTMETPEHVFPATNEAIAASAAAQETGHRSYFLQDVFKRVIVPEAHLVKPNLRWELRFRLLRLLGHTLAVVIFLWLAGALYTSDGHNRAYLHSVRQKAGALAATVAAFYKAPQPGTMPEVLSAARDLTAYAGLALADPPLAWRYGLYSVPPVLDASVRTRVRLQDNLLVPYLVRRVEAVLENAVAARDARQAYDTLRVYLMLHEKDRFSAPEVQAWVQSDWATGNGAAAFGGRVGVLEHLDVLLDGSRPVQSPYARNEALIHSARDFLDGNTSIERLYDRARAAMLEAAPQDFTLVRAVGPQAGTVFTRASGEPLERGIPGLFTYAGYHDLFSARLPEFVGKAQAVDAWVMGRTAHDGAQKKTLEAAAGKPGDNGQLTREIRRLYLEEYARRWSAFLADIRTVTGGNLGFDLEILRNFAAPDSPLARLGRAAVQETTLSRPLAQQDPSLAQKALSVPDKTAGLVQALNARAEARQERELVDNRFAALREVVTGQADAAAPDVQAAGAKPRLDAIAGMVNAYYTTQVVANNALNTRTLPPPADSGAQLRMEAARLPAPFAAVLADLVVQGTRDVNKGIGEILVAQMDAMIGESCRSAIEGKYPFALATAQDVDPGDFARIFAAGGVLDDFFQKVLAPHVDTTISPWRYKLTAPDVPPVAGPSLVPFQRARDIREVFFRDPGAKRLAWKVDLKVVGLDPEIVELNLDFDGQGQRYVHGPVVPLKITWPGPRGGQGAQISASPRIRPDTSALAASGPWALMRVVAMGKLAGSASASHFVAEYDFDGRKARLDINTGSLANPWTTGLLQGFECPGRS